MTTPAILGVDPGGRFVGIALVHAGDLEYVSVLDRRRLPGLEDRRAWVQYVLGNTEAAAEIHTGGPTVVAVEDVKAPNPHVRRRDGNALTNLDGILDTAVVVGALLAAHPGTVLVPPGGNGAGFDHAYPDAIRSGTRGLGGPTQHARSAYDVARAAVWHLRVEAAR